MVVAGRGIEIGGLNGAAALRIWPRRPALRRALRRGPKPRVVDRFRAVLQEAVELRPARPFLREEVISKRLQHATQQHRLPPVIDQWQRTQLRDLPLELRRGDGLQCVRTLGQLRYAVDIEEKLAPEEAADRTVGAGLKRLSQEGGQERQRAEEGAAQTARPLSGVTQVAEVAGAPAVMGVQGVGREKRSPAASWPGEDAAGRRDKERLSALPSGLNL